MPYISQEDRKKFISEHIDAAHTVNEIDQIEELSKNIDSCGDLNYVISTLCNMYINKKGLRYQNINDIMGALDGASKEFYRRVAAPYEDLKIDTNGDIVPIKETS